MAVGRRGRSNSSSSVDASVTLVGLVIDAAEDAGSTETMLERIDGMEARDRFRNGHRGGDSGETGSEVSALGRGVSSASTGDVCAWSWSRLSTERGDLARVSDVLRPRPRPSTVFLNELLRFLVFGSPCATSKAEPLGEDCLSPSLSSLLLRRNVNFDKIFPETVRRCGVAKSFLRSFPSCLSWSVTSLSMTGKGIGASGESDRAVVGVLMTRAKPTQLHYERRSVKRKGKQCSFEEPPTMERCFVRNSARLLLLKV